MSDFTFTLAPPRSIAGIAAFRNPAALHAALLTHFAVTLPAAGTLQSGEITWSRLAPARFLASADRAANLSARLAYALKDAAAITDQSDMWTTYILAGPAARDALTRIVPIDLHDQAFPIGALACTRAAHLDVRLTRTAQQDYELAVTRSFSADLHHALQSAAQGILPHSPTPPHHQPI